jgi:transposase-like protein
MARTAKKVRDQEITIMLNNSNSPAVPCPECKFPIRFSIVQILFDSEFKCPGCGLVLHLDRNESRKSLEALQQIHIAMVNAEKARRQAF